MAQKTPLYEEHLKAGGKMVDFFGWEMPTNYGSQIEEHHFVRKDVGIFDVSHMTVVDVSGPEVVDFLHHLVANNIDKLNVNGKALYTAMLNERGGIIDDLIIYWIDDGFYRLVVNSATREKDLKWIQKQANEFAVEVVERPELAMIAVQGPNALACAKKSLPEKYAPAIDKLEKPFNAVFIDDWQIARTGYTGEDGVEIVMPKDEACALWEALVKNGAHPCGLGARDTLRLESGMNLYGQDMDDTVTPLECNIAWTVGWEPVSRTFVGRKTLDEQKANGVEKILVGLVLEERGVLRNKQKVVVAGVGEGEITSGGFSPTLQKGIAMARVPKGIGAECQVEMRGKLVPAKVVKMPFVKKGNANF
jgi:aminomethyltransferase